ncbi:MAG: exodeoxyribonuclease V subunit gamma [Sandaracinaceae bacterium]
MIRLTYSNRTEALLDALVRRVDEGANDPLAPIWIVVPNANVERFVELGVARRLGVAANLRFSRLAQLTDELLPGPLLGGDRLIARVLRGLLDEGLLADPALAPVRRYLAAAGDAPAATEPRRAQLALHVAHLFEEYGFSRAELLETWTAGEARFTGTPHAGTEAWQAALFRFASRTPSPARTLGQAIDALEDPALPSLHVFGLSYVARVFARLFGALGERTALSLYALNPCEEFWEDVETAGELRRRRRGTTAEPEWLFEDEDPFALSVDTETPLLRQWGRPGREHVRLLGALTDCDFEAAFVDPLEEADPSGDAALPLLAPLHAPPLLHRIQHDVLTRAPRIAPPAAVRRDESVVVIGAPSLRREVETVAAEIWRLVDTVDDLTFDEIAVLVNGPDRDAYLPHVEAVFGEARAIPFNVTDVSLASVSPLVEGALRLLALPTEPFDRPEVLAVMTHPAVMAAVPDIEPHEWVALVDRLGIFHGIDHDELADTYVGDEDRLSWEQGIVRIALGAHARGEVDGRPRPLAIDGHDHLPEEAPVGSLVEARFALLARSLSSDVRFARAASLPLEDWSRFAMAMMQSYLTATDEREAGALRRALGVAERLAALDVDGTPVRWPIVWELLRGPLEELAGTRGQHLADGVVVSSLVPMRAIPFRVIFVLGLGEGRFPAADRRDSMDLRAVRRLAGDVTPPERDRYTFLETLLCARDRLILSYVARDERTGEPLAPSVVVTELLDVIEDGYLPGARTTLVRRNVPLRRHEEEAAREVLAEAAREQRARRLGERLREDLEGRLPAHLVPGEVSRAVARDPAMEHLLGLAPLPRAEPGPDEARTLRLSLAALRRFLECPLQGWTRAVLRLDDDRGSADATRAEEPFEPGRLDETIVLRASFEEAVLAGEPWRASYGRVVEAAIARGRWPLGPFARLFEEKHEAIFETWRTGFEAIGADRVRRVRLGAADTIRRGVEAADPIVLELADDPRRHGRPLRVELVGATELLAGDASVSLLLHHKGGAAGRVEELRHALRAFFDQVALTLLGQAPGPHRSVQLYADRDAPVRVDHAPIDPASARAWLTDLVADLFAGAHDYLFPIDAATRLADRFGSVDGEAIVAAIGEVRERGGGQSRWGACRGRGHPSGAGARRGRDPRAAVRARGLPAGGKMSCSPARAHGAARVAAKLGERPWLAGRASHASAGALARADVARRRRTSRGASRLAPGLDASDRQGASGWPPLARDRGLARLDAALDRLDPTARRRCSATARSASTSRCGRRGPSPRLVGPGRRSRRPTAGFLSEARLRWSKSSSPDASRLRLGGAPDPDAAAALGRVLAHPSVTPAGPGGPDRRAASRRRGRARRASRSSAAARAPARPPIVVAILRARWSAATSSPRRSRSRRRPKGGRSNARRDRVGARRGRRSAPRDRAPSRACRARARSTVCSAGLRRSGAFVITETSPLSERLVILDEGSMIDVFLMDGVVASPGANASARRARGRRAAPSVAAGGVPRPRRARADGAADEEPPRRSEPPRGLAHPRGGGGRERRRAAADGGAGSVPPRGRRRRSARLPARVDRARPARRHGATDVGAERRSVGRARAPRVALRARRGARAALRDPARLAADERRGGQRLDPPRGRTRRCGRRAGDRR